MHSYNGHDVQKSCGTDSLATKQDTIPTLLHIPKMCFNGSFSNGWRCEGSQQTYKTTQVTTIETPILATHWTIEKTWIS